MPKVSVIIPVYNVEKYLKECLDSVVNQTLSDIEIICVDDGSTDRSLSILKEYASSDDRFVILTQENQGSGIARNAALDIARGDYIGFMDADDYYPDTDTLRRLYNAAKKNKAKICGGSLMIVKEDGEVRLAVNNIEPEQIFTSEGYCDYYDYQYDFLYGRFIYLRSMLFENDLRFPPYRRFQDPPFFVKAMHTAKWFYHLPDASYVCRVSVNNEINKNNGSLEKTCDMLRGLSDVLDMSCQYNYKELHVRTIKRVTMSYCSIIKDMLHFPEVRNGLDSLIEKIDDSVIGEYLSTNDFSVVERWFSNIKLIIYGTGIMGKLIVSYLKKIQNVSLLGACNSSIKSFEVWDYDGVKLDLRSIDEWYRIEPNARILVATQEIYHDDIIKNCSRAGFKNIIPVWPELIEAGSISSIDRIKDDIVRYSKN